MSDEASIGICCGQCGGDLRMWTCPTHDWLLLTICKGCLLVHAPGGGDCSECDYSVSDLARELEGSAA